MYLINRVIDRFIEEMGFLRDHFYFLMFFIFFQFDPNQANSKFFEGLYINFANQDHPNHTFIKQFQRFQRSRFIPMIKKREFLNFFTFFILRLSGLFFKNKYIGTVKFNKFCQWKNTSYKNERIRHTGTLTVLIKMKIERLR